MKEFLILCLNGFPGLLIFGFILHIIFIFGIVFIFSYCSSRIADLKEYIYSKKHLESEQEYEKLKSVIELNKGEK